MLLGARQFFEKRGAPTPPLPYDYAVEYIETDGVASYIDTGVIAGNDTFRWNLDFQVVSRPSDTNALAGFVCGASIANLLTNRRFCLAISTSSDVFHFNVPNSSNTVGPSFNLSRHTASCSWDGLSFDGESVAITSTKPSVIGNSSFCLGRWGREPYVINTSYSLRSYSNVRIYSCILRDNGAVVFNGAPVVANGMAGLYDSISGTVKFNAAASGTITAGPRA